MKISQIFIGSIIAIEAYMLLYSPEQRYNFHTFIQSIKSHIQCECIQNWGYQCIQQLRYFIIALMISGSYSLILGNNLIVAILAQLSWMITQFQFSNCQSYNIKTIRNILIQTLFLVVLFGQLKNQWKQCCDNKKKQQKIETQKAKLKQQQQQKSQNTQMKSQSKKQGIDKYKTKQTAPISKGSDKDIKKGSQKDIKTNDNKKK